MDAAFLSRLQFAITIGFHYIYPPMSIGLGLLLVIMEGLYLRTGKPLYQRMTRFWVKIFALTFAMGVATGIVMEFEFGTNWARYSRYVGDVFGSALAAEGIFAFFLESGFLAILVFGWDRVGPKIHFLSTLMVSLGSMFSAVWIVVANSWMQTPAGFHIVGEGMQARAETTDFWGMIFNPSSVDRLIHVLGGSWLAGAFLVISISAYYLLRRRHTEFAESSLRIALIVAFAVSLFQIFTGHRSAVGVSRNQPAKLAAMEAVYTGGPRMPLYLFGWVDEERREVRFGVALPSMLSWLIAFDPAHPVQGFDTIPADRRPPVAIVFESYHLMIAIGAGLLLLPVLGLFFRWRQSLPRRRLLLRLFVLSVLGPQIANQAGWITAEVGRQPWLVYGLLRTPEGLSRGVGGGAVFFSLMLFTLIYLVLFALFLFLLNEKIRHGPEEDLAAGRESGAA